MKKSLLLTLLMPGLALVSCNKDDDPRYTNSYTAETYSLITNVTDPTYVSAVKTEYTFGFEMYSRQAQMACTELKIDDAAYAFASTWMPFEVKSTADAQGGYYQSYIFKGSGDVSQSASTSITGVSGCLTEAVNPLVAIPGVESTVPRNGRFVLLQYRVNNIYDVRTFWPDVVYRGETSVSGASAPFTTGNIQYRVKINLSSQTADIYMLGAQFAEAMPKQDIAVKGLRFEAGSDGYVITGENVEPEVITNGQSVPMPAFTFNKIDMSCKGNLTRASISYRVAGRYDGYFSGTFLISDDILN